MSDRIEIIVRGKPAPGGSKTPIPLKRGGRYIFDRNGRIIINMIDAGKGNKEWRKAVAAAGKVAMSQAGLDDLLDFPLQATVDFFMPRPKHHYVASNPERPLRPDAPPRPASKPDATKLWRSTEDALTGVVWVDDGRIVKQTIEKLYAPRGSVEGAIIIIERFKSSTLFEEKSA